MTIGQYIKLTDINTYHKLINMCKVKIEKPKPIKLGCSVEELMGHDSYKKVKGRVKQRSWS